MTPPYPTVPGVNFKDIPGFPGYCVGDDGSVWSCFVGNFPTNTWHQLKPRVKPRGHLLVELSSIKVYIHQIVLYAFVGPKPLGREACHEDGNPANNKLENLRWDTAKANSADARRHGTMVLGVRVCTAKLSEDDVREVRRLRRQGLPYYKIGDRFGVNKDTIRDIIIGKRWKHVIDEP